MKKAQIMSIILTAILLAVGISGCENEKKANLYVALDDGSRVYPTYISNVKPGADGHSGKNLISSQIGTFEYNGVTFRTYHIPKGQWDIYCEWMNPESVLGHTNGRWGVNTEKNDWVAIYFLGEFDSHLVKTYNNIWGDSGKGNFKIDED